jgi:hypothetical protein
MYLKTYFFNILMNPIYIIDFFNIFSDYREMKYKKLNIDFHSLKHSNKEQDTTDFFDIFFTKYIQYANIKSHNKFIFIMKKLNNSENLLQQILIKYLHINIQFIIIEEKYSNSILDKNKDDFLCQYFFWYFRQQSNCFLISNDKYRDKHSYINLFNFDISLTTLIYNHSTHSLQKKSSFINATQDIPFLNNCNPIKRSSIPKHKLSLII